MNGIMKIKMMKKTFIPNKLNKKRGTMAPLKNCIEMLISRSQIFLSTFFSKIDLVVKIFLEIFGGSMGKLSLFFLKTHK